MMRKWLLGIFIFILMVVGCCALGSCKGSKENVSEDHFETEGVLYEISADGTYAKVVGYEGIATQVSILDTYND